MAEWDTSGPADTGLADAGNGNANPIQPGGQRNHTMLKEAIDKGWSEGKAFNYAPTSSDPAPSGQPDVQVPAWAHNAAKYEYKEEYGDVAPRLPKLEEELFGSELRITKGIQFDQ